MGAIRMFHFSCDADIRGFYDCEIDTGDEWYASAARQQALSDGWHLSGSEIAICPACWEHGARFKNLNPDN